MAPVLVPLTLAALALYAPETFALSTDDAVAELEKVTEGTSKIVKNFCHIIGLGSIGWGMYGVVVAQNLKILAGAAVITLAAFKAPVYFSQTMII